MNLVKYLIDESNTYRKDLVNLFTRNRSFLTFILFLLIFVTSACGFIPNTSLQQSNQQNVDDSQQTNNDQQGNQVTPVQPNQVFQEIPFKTVSYIPYNFKPRPKGGIYIYTKEAHAGNIADDFESYWDKEDMLYVQLGNQYRGYEIEPMALEKRNNNTVRIVLQLKATEKAGYESEDPARKFLRVPKGSLKGYNFEVVDESGNALKLQ